MDEEVLKDLLATGQAENWNWDVIMPKFPELKDVDLQLLKDYAATAKANEYDYAVINPKFPELSEFFEVKKNGDPTGSVSADGGLELRDTRDPDYTILEEPIEYINVPAQGKLGEDPLPEDRQGTVKVPNPEYSQQLEAYERQLKDQEYTSGLIDQERIELENSLPTLKGPARTRAIRQLYDKDEATYDAEQQAIKDAEAWAKEQGQDYVPKDTRERDYKPLGDETIVEEYEDGRREGYMAPLDEEGERRNKLDIEYTEWRKSQEDSTEGEETDQRELARKKEQEESLQRRRAELQKEEGFVKDIAAVTAEDMDLTEEAGQKRLNDLYGKYGFLFEQIGVGDALLVTAEDGSTQEIDLQPFGVPIIGKTLKATKKDLQKFISDHAMPAIEPVAETAEEMSSLDKAYKANIIRGVGMKNEDGSSSTHLMAAEVIDGKWVAFPTLFPITEKIDGGGVGVYAPVPYEATSNPNDWMQFGDTQEERDAAYKEALKRGEVFEFDTKEEALAFGEGSWKNADIAEYGLYKFMKDNGVDGEVYLNRYREYHAAHDELEFIDSNPPLRVGYLSEEDQEKYGEKYYGKDGKLRNDYKDFIPEIEKEISEGRSVINDEQFMELRGDYDAQTEKLRLKASVEASNLNKEVKLGLEKFNEQTLEMFNVPLGEILDVVPTTQEEVDLINSIINESQSLYAVQSQAATQYELSQTFLNAKFNPDASAHLLDNMEAFANNLQTGWKRGEALDEIMLGALGIDDLSDDATRAEKAAAIVKYLEAADTGKTGRQMENYNTARGFIDTMLLFLKNPVEMSTTVMVESMMQMAPHGLKAGAVLIPTGAAVGSLAGPQGLVYGTGKGLQTTMAYLGFVMEYGNGAIDAMVNQGYDITDPMSVEKALQDEKVWDEAWEVGGTRGLTIGSLSFLSGLGAGEFVKRLGPLASRVKKVGVATIETAAYDPITEGGIELIAQAAVDQNIDFKEAGLEAMGGFASNTALRVYNLAADEVSRDRKEMVLQLGATGVLKDAKQRTLPTTEGTEQLSDPAPIDQRDEAPKRMTRKLPPILSKEFYNISDKDLSSFINRMLKIGKVSDQQAQEALVNVGIRGEVRDILGNDAPLSEQSEIFHLLAEKKQLEANPAKKTANQGRIGEITTRIQEITNEVTIKEQVADANAARREQLEAIIEERNIVLPFGVSDVEYRKAQKAREAQVKRKEEARQELADLDAIKRPSLWDSNSLYNREFDSEESIPSDLRELESVERVVGDDGKITLSFTGQQLSDADITKTQDYAIQEPSTEEVGQDVKAEKEETTSSSDDIIDRAREGDIEAQETLKEYGIEWEKQSTYRFIGESEVEALEKGETIKGKSEQAGVDITTSEDVTTATDADYRVTFKEEGFDNKKEDSRVRMKNDKDGWIPKGYDKSDVAKIEKINADGTYETVYEAEVEAEGEEVATKKIESEKRQIDDQVYATFEQSVNTDGTPRSKGTVTLYDSEGNEVGFADYSRDKDGKLRASVDVNPEFQRKGYATEMYIMIEEKTGEVIYPNSLEMQSNEARALWEQPNRPFGPQEEAALEVTEESLAEGKQELVEIEEGKTTITKPVKIFKGIGGKKDVDGNSISAHKGVEGVFSTTEEEIADQYGVDEGVSEVVLPEGTTVEVVEVEAKGMTVGEVRAAEVEAINNSDAQVVKLKTLDGRIPKGQTRNVQYVIKDEALIEQLSKPSVEEQQDESTQGFMSEELDLNNPEDLTTFEESMDALIEDVSVDDDTDPVQNKKKKKAEEKITKDTKVKEKSKKLAQEILKNAEKYKAFIAEVGDSATDMANFIAVATTDYINGKTNEIVEKYDEVKKKIQKIVRDFKTAVMFSLAVLGASDNIIQVSKTADAYIQEVVIPEVKGLPDYIERGLVKYGGLDVEESVAPEVEEEIVEAKVEETGETTITLPQNEIHNEVPEKRDGGGVILSQHSNYYDNEDGFVYNPIPTKGNKKAPQKVDGAATAHFFILDERPSDFKDIYDADQKELQRQSEWFKNRREFKSANDSDFFPVFTKLEDGNVQVKYKRKGEITSEDAVIQKLVQHQAGNIDFEKTQPAGDQYKGIRGYKDYKVLVTKDGKGIQSVIFKDENLYSKFSGAAGLFIAETPDGKRYVKDFAGSVKNMKDGLKSFAEITGVNQDDITIAFYDSGSVTAKPVGKDGKINRRDSQYFNTKVYSGSGLALPVGFDKAEQRSLPTTEGTEKLSDPTPIKEKDQVVEKPVLKPSEDAPTIPKSSTFDSFIESLDSAIEAIDESTKGTLGINIAPATLKTALQLIKQTAIATKNIAEGIKAGIDFIRKSEWYKNLSKDEKAELTDEKIKEQFGIDPPSKERLDKIIEDIVNKTRKRNAGKNTSTKKIKENVLSYLQQTRWYEEASDIQREEAVQEILKQLGEKRKKAPSVAKILGKIKDVKKITISEKVLLRNRLKALNEGAKNVLDAQKKAKADLTAEIKELVSSGKVTTKQLLSVINRFAKVNLLSDASIDSFVDYMAKVFADAEYAEKMEKANKLRARAKKNVKTKIGVADAIADQLNQVFSIKPTFIPDSVLDNYLELLDMFGQSKEILSPKDIESVNEMVQDILRVMDEEHSMVESLSEKFDNYDGAVVKEDGSIDYSATVKKMQDEGLIDEGEAVVMRKYKNDINPKEPKVELTEEEIQEQKDDLIEGISKATQDSSIFPSVDERKLAERFYNLVNDIKNLQGLSVKDLERIQALLETMENGYLPHFVDVMVNKMEGKNDGNVLSEALKDAKLTRGQKLYAAVKAMILSGSVSSTTRKAIERNPLAYIDRLFGNFKTKPIFDSIFKKSSKAYESYVIDLRKITDRIAKAEKAVIKSFNRNPNKILLSKFKQQVYLIQKEYESNKGNKEVNPAHKSLEATILAIRNGEVELYSDKDADLLQQILDEFTNKDTGEVDIDQLYKSFNAAEKASIKAVQEANESLQEKAVYTAGVIQGKRISPRDNYVHLNVLRKKKGSPTSLIEDFKNRVQGSTKSQVLQERSGGVSPLNFDVYASAIRGGKSVLMDYHLTNPIRQAYTALAQAKENLKNKNGVIPKDKRDIVVAIEDSYSEVIDNILNTAHQESTIADDVVNYIKKQGYRAVLASAPRVVAELTSNLSFVLSASPVDYGKGIKVLSLAKKSGSPVDIMSNLNSSNTNRLYPEGLSGRLVDQGVIDDKQGVSGGKARSEFINRLLQSYESTLGPVSNVVGKLADAMISTPDKMVMRPMWFGSFQSKFKELTGTDPDFKKIQENDEAYMRDNKEALDAATTFADEMSVMTGSTTNPFMGLLKTANDAEAGTIKKAFNTFNNYMTTFLIFEYHTAVNGIMNAIGKGELGRAKGIQLLAATTSRMVLYLFIGQILRQEIFGDEDDEELSTEDLLKKSFVSATSSLILGRDFGQATRAVINLGIEKTNEQYFDFLRDGEEYDYYRDAIAYTILPRGGENRQRGLADYLIPVVGPYASMVKTAELAVKKANQDPPVEEEAVERRNREIYQRLPLEVAGNLGFVPFYNDVRKMLLASIYAPLRKQLRFEKDKKAYKEKWIRYFNGGKDDEGKALTVPSAKKYDKGLWEDVFGDDSVWMIKYNRERWEKELLEK